MVVQQPQDALKALEDFGNRKTGLVRRFEATFLMAPSEERHRPVLVVLHKVVALAVLKQCFRRRGLHQRLKPTLQFCHHGDHQKVPERSRLHRLLVPGPAGVQHQGENAPFARCKMEQKLARC